MSQSVAAGAATKAIHAGEAAPVPEQPVLNPLSLATSFYAAADLGFAANAVNGPPPFIYTRWNNPTNDLLERRLAALEGGEAAVVFASGMAATAGLWLGKLKSGDHLVLSNVCYAGVAELAHDILPGFGIETTAVNSADLPAVAAAIRPNTKLIHVETPSNPILRLTDIAAVAALARASGAELAVDATMATPIALKPLELGADYVVHSLTKYACGHGDALGGAVIGREAEMTPIRMKSLVHFGAAINPFAAWLILRGLETLPARMAAHEKGALAVAAFLETHKAVRRVLYPGLASHPQHELAQRQMRNFSGMVTFSAAGDGPALARRLADQLKVWSYAVSLGKTRSLAYFIPSQEVIAAAFHLEGREAELYRDWSGDGAFRLSVGLEDPADLIADLDQALGG